MRTKLLLLVGIVASTLTGCETVVDSYGQRRQVMSPLGAAVLQTGVSTAIGAGTGALMRKSPGWANGAVSAGVGSIGSQVINAFIPQAGSYQRPVYASAPQYRPYQQPQQYRQPYYQQQQYQPMSNQGGTPLYYRRPDGSFARVQ
jgi:hypothetical protein